MPTNLCCGCHLEDDYGTSLVSGDGSQTEPYSLLQVDPGFNRPMVKIARSGVDQAIPQSTPTAIQFFGPSFDTDGMFNALLNTRLTVQIAGIYLMGFNGAWFSFANIDRQTSFRLNGVSILSTQSQVNNDAVTAHHYYDMTYLWPLAVDDYIEVIAFNQNPGGIAMHEPQFWMMYLGKEI